MTTSHERHLLREIALLAKESAYAPYSRFRVGAAILTAEGNIFHGCNIENSSYSLTVCAERTALFQAVAKGCKKFRAIAIASDDPGFITPCGACRQVLSEFAPSLEIILIDGQKRIKVTSLKRLFPTPPDLKKLSAK
jgi:cytidine deaminase